MSEELDLGSYMIHVSTFFKHLYACDSAYYYHMIYICMPEPSRNLGAGFRFRLTSDVFLHHLLGLKEATKDTLDGSEIPFPTTVWM